MPEASNEIVINRPAAEVFAYLANPVNDRNWRSGVLEMSRISGEGRGARYHQVVAGPGGRKVTADIEITDFQPTDTIAFRTITGPVRPVGQYQLTPEAGGTRLSFSLKADIGGIKKLVMGGMVQKTMNAEVAALEKLKAVLEGTPPG